ncbi:MAG: PEGA domain-containing protein, partial [Deltaproteobacteria bacterium]
PVAVAPSNPAPVAPAAPAGRGGEGKKATAPRPAEPPAGRPGVLASADALEGLELPPASSGEGILFVNALPWAEIQVDGRVEGITPRELRLAAGRHRLRLVHPTRGAVEREADVRAGERLRVEIPLNP